MEDFYARDSLHVRNYDARPKGRAGVTAGDIEFFSGLSAAANGPVLDLGSGTGRISVPLAEAGRQVVGLERSQPMLNVAREKLATLDAGVRDRLRFVEGDMADFDLGERFSLVVIAFRTFQLLLTPELERSCLRCVHRHLDPGGMLTINVFDPLLDRIAPDASPETNVREVDAGAGLFTEVESRTNDALTQVMEEVWLFAERDERGEIILEERELLRMRWIHRQEMRYLFELCGFEIEAEYSDYAGSPPAYGKEQIWVARKVG